MNIDELTAFDAALNAACASTSDLDLPAEDRSRLDQAFEDEFLKAFSDILGDAPRPKVVADAISDRPRSGQPSKPFAALVRSRPQCASPTPALPPSIARKLHRQSAHAARTTNGQTRTTTTALPAVRKPKRKAAQIDALAATKTWAGKDSKNRKDKLTEAEKMSAAVFQVAEAGGRAVSLNLGIRRESMLMFHDDPRRRMMQNMNKHLKAAGLEHVPYGFVFEVTREPDGNRLHLHGVVGTTGLSSEQYDHLHHALCKAASEATGALGGKRQLVMDPLHDPAGWADYMLKGATRTARELGIAHVFMRNNRMTRAAKGYFEALRREQRSNGKRPTYQLGQKSVGGHVSIARSTPCGFTFSLDRAIVSLSGERDQLVAGEGILRVDRQRHRPLARGAEAAFGTRLGRDFHNFWTTTSPGIAREARSQLSAQNVAAA